MLKGIKRKLKKAVKTACLEFMLRTGLDEATLNAAEEAIGSDLLHDMQHVEIADFQEKLTEEEADEFDEMERAEIALLFKRIAKAIENTCE